MNTKLILGFVLLVAVAVVISFAARRQNKTEAPVTPAAPATSETKPTPMEIKSSVFADGGSIPSLYTCDGKSINPPLEFSNIPAGTKSLALTVDDPDVPKTLLPSGVFDHWVVFNMPADTQGIAENSTPPGVQGNNGAGKPAYTGPCPPDREHRYFFKLYALDTMLDLPTGATKAQVEQAIQGHIVGQTQMIGKYNKISNQK